jgi:hypothetical protein
MGVLLSVTLVFKLLRRQFAINIDAKQQRWLERIEPYLVGRWRWLEGWQSADLPLADGAEQRNFGRTPTAPVAGNRSAATVKRLRYARLRRQRTALPRRSEVDLQ